ncbi:MAG: phosphoenolpyruvate mutase [Clostridia bacterium]|nr:phosphoenolpyruvate mutase [Clostridia bacterium]
MIALIINSGIGSRMGELTKNEPKCMTKLFNGETILERQLKQLVYFGIKKVIVTTGYLEDKIINHCNSLDLPIDIKFVKNEKFRETNYIYSVECAKEYLDDDIVFMHGDLVFEDSVLKQLLHNEKSCMAVSSTTPLPEKDFKAVIKNGRIDKVGVNFFDDALTAQPLYKILREDWNKWLNKISEFCKDGNDKVYAENAFNEISDKCVIYPLDVKDSLCEEIDNANDLERVVEKLKLMPQKTVYMAFSTDIILPAHISIINKASRFGRLIVGILSEAEVIRYKKFSRIKFEERKMMFANISNISEVVVQNTLSYKENILTYKPDIVVHGDNWVQGPQAHIRAEVVELLAEYGGKLIEFPYTKDENYQEIEEQLRNRLSIPDIRRGRLKKILRTKNLARVIEAHSGITGLIAEETIVHKDGKNLQFDAMWISSLCDSTVKGKPDIELVDYTSRLKTIDEIMEVTTKPIILDGDTGGKIEHFSYLVRTLERIGVSAIIIEDKVGLKKNSLFGTDVVQTQDTIENFSQKIIAGKLAQKTKDFMIIARIESLILEKGMDDALERAFAFTKAGADGIMIHSRKKDPSEIFEFVAKFREQDSDTPIVVVPTSFNTVTEDEFEQAGVNIVIYANQLIRSGIPAMKKVAETILYNQRAKEADDLCMPIKEILSLIKE